MVIISWNPSYLSGLCQNNYEENINKADPEKYYFAKQEIRAVKVINCEIPIPDRGCQCWF